MKPLVSAFCFMAALIGCSALLRADDPPLPPGVEAENIPQEVHLKDKPKPTGYVMKVEQCFKIHWMLRADEAHYWADWISECPYTIDSVYVMIGFLDHGKKHVSNGVWPMYFVLPGAHQVTRFSAPAEAAGFEMVIVHKVTTESAEAFSQDRNTVEALYQGGESRESKAQSVGQPQPASLKDNGYGRVIPAK